MFVEEGQPPLKVEILATIVDKDEFRSVLIRLFADIEKRPLRSSEVSLIKDAVIANLARLDIQNDKQLNNLLSKRFSCEFLPGVSNLGVGNIAPKRIGSVTNIAQHQINTGDEDMTVSKGKNNRMLRVNSNSGRVIYQLCSVRRQQTALSSSYKMYADGIKEFDGTGALISTTMNEVPLLLYGAKKFKGGAVSQSLVWNVSDVKLWKEKAAVGKISKQTNSRYYGCLLPTPVTANTLSSGLPSTLMSAEDESQNVSMADEPLQETNSTMDSALSTSAQDTEIAAGIADTDMTDKASTSPRVQSSRWNFRGSNNTACAPPPVHPSSNHSTSALSAAAAQAPTQDNNSNSIAVCVSCKGMDKLIHLSGLAVKASLSSGIPRKASAESMEAAADHSNARKLSVSTISTAHDATGPIGEQVLLDQLDALQRGELTLQDTESLGVLQIVSKLPRKVPTAGGKIMHSVAFGKESRVRAASRKNLVIESVTAGSAGQAAEATSVEWGTDANKLPLLQMGKLEEGTFSLDFHELSPFQAFTIALAAFDQ